MAVKSSYKFAVALLWLSLISYLFFLPGSALPKDDLFDDIQFDKWVHIGFFTILTSLWSWALWLNKRGSFVLLFMVTVVYGLLVEIGQDRLVINRSFDGYDLIADSVGSVLGILVYTKKINPCRNRGRNQN
jgi:VanZ family protein